MALSGKIRGVAGAFSLSVLNQMVSSGTNFILGVYLVKTLSPSDYGLYGIALAISLFYGGLVNSLFLTQMVVNSSEKSQSELVKLAASTLINILICSFLMIFLVTILLSIFDLYFEKFNGFYSYFFSVCGVCITYIVKEFFVRHAYNVFKESWALYIHITLALSLLTSLVMINYFNNSINLVKVLCAYSFAHLCGAFSGCLLARLPLFKVNAKQLWLDACVSWAGGRWTIISGVVYFVRTQAHTIVVTALMGPVGVAKLNATRLLVTPPVILIPALGQVVFPRLARLAVGNKTRLFRCIKLFTMIILSASIVYSVILVSLLDVASAIILDNKYKSIKFLIVTWCVYICVFSIRTSIDITVQVMKGFKEQMIAYVLSALVAFATTYVFVKYFFEDSYVIGMIIGEIVVAALLFRVLMNMNIFVKGELPVSSD